MKFKEQKEIKLNLEKINGRHILGTAGNQYKEARAFKGKGKKDIYVKRAGEAIVLKLTSEVGSSSSSSSSSSEIGSTWQNLNENQRRFNSVRLVKSLYEGDQGKRITSIKPRPINQLETRLDVLVYRLNLAQSLLEAREIIKKGFIQVNSIVVKYPGFQVTEMGSLIKSTTIKSIYARISQKDIPLPSYLYSTGPLNGILIYKPIYDSTNTHGPLKFYHRSFGRAIARSGF